MVVSSANAGVARNSAARSDALKVLRIISFLLLIDCVRPLNRIYGFRVQSKKGD
jgi:hypothetical protein